nr:MAG TPA: hypothetical protein [Caudoviricetes sp.]
MWFLYRKNYLDFYRDNYTQKQGCQGFVVRRISSGVLSVDCIFIHFVVITFIKIHILKINTFKINFFKVTILRMYK